MALKLIKRMYYQGKVVAYLKKNNSILRYKLAMIEEKYLTTKYRVKPGYPFEDSELLNQKIDELEERVDNKACEILYSNPLAKITNMVMAEALKQVKIEESEIEEDKNIIIYDFDKYIEDMKLRKAEEDAERGISRKLHPSCKDFISTRNALADYEYDNRILLHLSDITPIFISDFVDYLADERIPNENHTYLTKGSLVNATINKRLDCLAALTRNFYKDLKATEIILEGKQDSEQADVIRLTKDELTSLASMDLNVESECRIRDYFVFLCLTGLRYSDFCLIDKSNFVPHQNGYILRLYTHKTIKRAEIPLTNKAIEIAHKYEFRFDYYTNQAFNRQLKELLARYDLFGDEIIKYRQIKKGVEKVSMLRREKISAHTGRRTFISILVENGVNLPKIMAMTGHTKESTLKIYVDRFSPNLKDAIVPLEF